MTNCPRCNFKLDPIDVKAGVCPVCEKPLAKQKDPRVAHKKDERVKRPL